MSQYGACPYRLAVNRVQHARDDLPPDVNAFYDRVKQTSAASTGHSTARPEASNPVFGRCPT